MSKIYVASSWRNPLQPDIVRALRDDGHEVYDFREPRPGKNGFAWSDVGFGKGHFYEGDPDLSGFVQCLQHPVAVQGFGFDKEAMDWADTFVLVLPCGRSAHLEAGWAAGAGKRVIVLLSEEKFEPELMYLLCSEIVVSLDGARRALGVSLSQSNAKEGDHNV